MKIVKSEASSIDIRLTESLTTAAGGVGDRSGLRLTITTDSPFIGLGETAPIPGVDGPGLDAIAAELKAWSTSNVGEDVDAALANLDSQALTPLARFAAHTALIDLASQHAGAPLSQWLRAGAQRSIRVNALVAESNPATVHARVISLVDDGIRCIKLKVGAEEPAVDITRIIAASEAGGPDVELRLDANRAWDSETVVRVVGRVGKYRISYLEDPTPDIFEYRSLQEEVDVSIALDLPSTDDPAALVERVGVRAVVVKPAAIGGVDRVIDLARSLENVRMVLSSSIDREVALAAAIHAAAALPSLDEFHGLATGSMVRGLPGSLLTQSGVVTVPSDAGVFRAEAQ